MDRLVLDYLTGRTRVYQCHPMAFHEHQVEWAAHTEPDIARGNVWMSLDQQARVLMENVKHRAGYAA
jgi:hypothetical protein